MLNKLRIENFKAWREADLTLGKVTGFFGPNSAGKSSLLQFLLLLKQTRNATDRGLVLDFGGPGHMVNLGTFKDVVHQQDEQTRISWALDWTLSERLRINDPMKRRSRTLFVGDCLRTRCEVGLRQTRLWPHELAYRFAEVEFMLQPEDGSETEFDLVDTAEYQFIRNRGRPWRLPRPVKTYRRNEALLSERGFPW